MRARRRWSACAQGRQTGTRRRPGRRGWPSTTQSASGASPTTRDSSAWTASTSLSSWPTATATGLLRHARLTIYGDAAHGFLFQHHAEFAEDVEAFLDEPAPSS